MVFIVLKVFIVVNVNDFRIRWQLSTQVQLLIIRTQYFNWYELPGFFRRKHDYLSGCFCGGTINNYFKFITGNWFTIISCYIDACRLDKIVSVFIKWESPDQCVMWSRWVEQRSCDYLLLCEIRFSFVMLLFYTSVSKKWNDVITCPR